MGLGYGAGAAGFIVTCFAILILIMVIASWIGWQHCKSKHTDIHPTLDISVKASLFSVLMIPMFVAFTFVMIFISNFSSNRAQQRYEQQLYLQLDHPFTFGEIVLPKGTWINREFDKDHSLEQMVDIRQGLRAARFSSKMKVAQFEATAFELNGNLYVELAHDHKVRIEGKIQTCPTGWLIELSDRGMNLNQYRYDLDFDWFKPSQWKPISCFDGNLIVLESK